MEIYELHREQFLPITLDKAWDFFSAPDNLEKITPKDMGFEVLTDVEGVPMYEGMEIAYKVRPLFGIPLSWLTVIGKVNAPYQFTDKQKKGPYAVWEHTHTFKEVKGGVMMTDDLKYALPFGVLGTIAHALLVKSRLNQIFDFRTKTLEQFFGK